MRMLAAESSTSPAFFSLGKRFSNSSKSTAARSKSAARTAKLPIVAEHVDEARRLRILADQPAAEVEDAGDVALPLVLDEGGVEEILSLLRPLVLLPLGEHLLGELALGRRRAP